MFLIYLLRYFRGMVVFTVRGQFIERFLNLAARGNIHIWNAKREEDEFIGCTLISDYKKFRPIVRKTHVQVRVSERYGLPFAIRKYHKRFGVMVGIGCFILVMLISGQFVWDITVSGNKEIPAEEVLDLMEDNGLHLGSFKKSLDVESLAESICVNFDEASWAAVNLIGTVAHIEIKERVKPPEMIEDKKPCNIVASKSGQIIHMDVQEGQKMTTIGSGVKKGDLIVSGIIQDKEGGTSVKHARAKVIAEYSEKQIFSFPLEQTEKVPQGGILNYKYLRINGKNFPMFIGKGRQEDCFERTYKRPAKLFGVRMPFEIIIRQVIPSKEQTISVTQEKAKTMAMQKMNQFEKEISRERKIISRKTQGEIVNGSFQITAKYVFQENISQESEIFIEKQHNS